MKIIIVGGNGTVGKAAVNGLKNKHEIIIAARNTGDVFVNLEDNNSIQKMYETVGKIDAVVSCAGAAKWKNFSEMSEEDFYVGLKSKLMGQVNLVRIGTKHINSGGSFTLTTGILADDPVFGTTNAAMVNNAIHGFVKAVSQELENGMRINAVSPGLVENSAEKLGHLFPGHSPVAMDKVSLAYVRSVEGKRSGEIIRVY